MQQGCKAPHSEEGRTQHRFASISDNAQDKTQIQALWAAGKHTMVVKLTQIAKCQHCSELPNVSVPVHRAPVLCLRTAARRRQTLRLLPMGRHDEWRWYWRWQFYAITSEQVRKSGRRYISFFFFFGVKQVCVDCAVRSMDTASTRE